jgi:isopentenyldiphosphate isomerase
MEVYQHPQGVSDDMMAGIDRLAQEMGLPAKRAAEIFTPLR